jgi:NADH dehydrogenase/NADH:ubiquinone oxidoreductase subunit G
VVKTILPWVIIALLGFAGFYYWGKNINKEEIERVKNQVQDMKSQRDSIKSLVALKDSMQVILQSKISDLEANADDLRDHISTLETQRAKAQLDVRKIDTPDSLVRKFADTFPELPINRLAVFQEKISGIDLTYLGVPIWFSETFIIDHQNSENYKEQRDEFAKLDSLNSEVISLNKKVLVLEREKAEAYKTGYDSAYVNYMEISKLYIKELEKPRFDLPHWGAVVGGAAAGYLIGRD